MLPIPPELTAKACWTPRSDMTQRTAMNLDPAKEGPPVQAAFESKDSIQDGETYGAASRRAIQHNLVLNSNGLSPMRASSPPFHTGLPACGLQAHPSACASGARGCCQTTTSLGAETAAWQPSCVA